MNLIPSDGISVLTVFLQGLLSFFSPCVLPLLPVYIGYLSGGLEKDHPDSLSEISEDRANLESPGNNETNRSCESAETTESTDNSKKPFGRRQILIHTLCFVLGIGFAFFTLGLGLRAVGLFFRENRQIFAAAGGILVILLGCWQILSRLGESLFARSPLGGRELRLPIRFDRLAMSPLTAFLLGFVFSFAWTPCVGPILSGVLLMAASAEKAAYGFVLTGVYTLGFSVPFLLTGLFTSAVLDFFRRHRNIVQYTTVLSGILLILMGALMVTGKMDTLSADLAGNTAADPTSIAEESGGSPQESAEGDEIADADEPDTGSVSVSDEAVADASNDSGDSNASASSTDPEREEDVFPAPDFKLTDQYGVTHSLSEYRGKVVFLNFWATWCPPCRAEMPAIQEIFEESLEQEDKDLVILGVAFPGFGRETTEQGVRDFLQENGYTYPVVMDTGGTLIAPYYITAYPTTYMIDRDGNIYGYVTGSLSKENMEDIIAQTKNK